MPTKFQDDWFINSWEILTFRPLEKEEEKNKNFKKFESFQVGFLGNNKPEIGRAIITIANILNIVIQIFFTKMFFVVRHLDVVLEDPLVVTEKSLFYKTCR